MEELNQHWINLNKKWSEEWRKGSSFVIDSGHTLIRNLHLIKTPYGICIKRPYTERDLKRDIKQCEDKLVRELSNSIDIEIFNTMFPLKKHLRYIYLNR
jgi:hypothetical protein